MNQPTAPARYRCVACILLLLLFQTGAAEKLHVNPQDANLHQAIEAGDVAGIKKLLADGADPNARDERGRTPLISGVSKKNGEIVKALLDKGADPNAGIEVDSEGAWRGLTALMSAASDGSEEIVKMLLDKGADPNAKDRYGLSALWYAASGAHYEISKLLLKKYADPNVSSGAGQTPLLFASKKLNEEVIRMLLERGAKPNVSLLSQVGWENDIGKTPLMYVAAAGNEALVRLLIEKGAEFSATDSRGESALEYARRGKSVAVVQALLGKGADPNVRDAYGRTPLMNAIMSEQADIVRLLVENKANVNVLTENSSPLDDFDKQLWGLTPLMIAAQKGQAEIVRLLVEKGAEVDARARKEAPAYGTSALAAAASYGDKVEIVKILLDHKADANQKDERGNTPLLNAAYQDNPGTLKMLIDGGADVNYQDEQGRTALMRAVDLNRAASVAVLLENSANVNEKDARGKTVLMIAAGREGDRDNATIIKLLLDKGADHNLFDSKDQNALMYAAESGNEAAVKLLLEKGTNVNAKNKKGVTPLMYAAAALNNSFNYVVETLMATGADVNARDVNGNTALLVAARFGRVTTAEVLLSKGAALNARNEAGDNALLVVAGSKWRGEDIPIELPQAGALLNAFEMATVLLDRGMNVNARNKAGETALMLASAQEDRFRIALVHLLLDRGAAPGLKDAAGKTARQQAEEAGNAEVAKVLASAEAGTRPRGTLSKREAAANPRPGQGRNTSRTSAAVREPSEAFWKQFVVSFENNRPSVMWSQTNPTQNKTTQALIADLTAAGFGRDNAPRDLKDFWEQLDQIRKERLKRKHAVLFAAYEESPAADEVARLFAPHASSMLRRMSGLVEGDDTTELFEELIAEMDEELAKLTPQLFMQLRNKGIGMDADTVSRLLGDSFKGPRIRSMRALLEKGMKIQAWEELEASRSAPFTLLQHKRPVLVSAEPKKLRDELIGVNLEIIHGQQEVLRLANDFKASGGELRDVFPNDENRVEEDDPASGQQSAAKGKQQLKDAYARVKNLFVHRAGLIAELVDDWGQESSTITARQAAKLLPQGTLSVVFAYESSPLRVSATSLDKIHVLLLQGGARADGDEATDLTPPLMTRTLELSPVELAQEMNAFRAVVTQSNTSVDDIASRGRNLFAKLFPGELGDAVRNARQLIISPDGPLWDMPFSALVTNSGGAPVYLGLEKPLSYTASLTQLAQAKNLPPRLSKGQEPFALVLGDPNFNRRAWLPAGAFLVRSFLDPLPATREEAGCISKLYGAAEPLPNRARDKGVLLLGNAATEVALRRWIEKADVIHLATHGYIDTARQLTMNSGVWLTPPQTKPVKSYLANDGALQAAEVFNQLKLRADLVVISACEMGRGQDLKGAGVADMIWALQAAGARSVVASQWEVADQSTSTLMIAFHGFLCQGMNKDEALRLAMAKLHGAARTSHPYFWAPFILSGDTSNNLSTGRTQCNCASTP